MKLVMKVFFMLAYEGILYVGLVVLKLFNINAFIKLFEASQSVKQNLKLDFLVMLVLLKRIWNKVLNNLE